MLSVNQISKSYGIETVLDGVSFQLNPGDRLGLVGPNGCGKTTLLRILAGDEKPDSGSFHFSQAGISIGYLPQGMTFEPEESVGNFINRMEGDLTGLTAHLEQLAGDLAIHPQQPEIQEEYDQVLTRIALASENAGRGPAVMAGLGLGEVALDAPLATLSGGQKTRLALAGVLLGSPEIMFLDEPTNHLDLEMLEWLEDWLLTLPTRHPVGVLIVSHDRAFLDRVATGILEIDPQTHKSKAYVGNYTGYLEQKLAEREKQQQAYADQQEEIKRMLGDIHRTKQQAARVEQTTTPRQPGVRRIAKKVARKASSREKKLERYLESDERVEKPSPGWQMKLEFTDTPESGKNVVSLVDLAVGYGDKPLLTGIQQVIRAGERVALVGPNGSGKTTLLRTIAGLIPPLAGQVRLGPSVKAGYMRQEQEDLDPGMNALQTIQGVLTQSETEARNFLHYFLFAGDDVFTPVGKLSYGERSRLSLACLVAQGCNLLMLDEPLNHLDIPSRDRFEQALARYEGTVLAVVHDRYFIQGFATQIWEVNGSQITDFRL